MIVLNNPTAKESTIIADIPFKQEIVCMLWSVEHAHDKVEDEERNDTEHYHVYVSFKQPKRFAYWKDLLPRAHVEVARKPTLACCRYVAKEGFYIPYGAVPDLTTGYKQGTKRQREAAENMEREKVIHEIRNGKLKYSDLSDEQLLDRKLREAAEKALTLTSGPMREDLYVCCFVSPTKWGKSYSIWNTFHKLASVEFSSSQEWFINAEEDVMLFDEFCGQVRCQKMLKYLDIYPISLPVKGGHRPCYWKAIFICSNTSPDEWYMKENPVTHLKESSIPDDVRQALYRRIGYPVPNERGETHIYNAQFTNWQSARKEMNEICHKIYNKIYQEDQPETTDTQPLEEEEEEATAAATATATGATAEAEQPKQKRLESRDLEHWDGPKTEQGAPLLGAFLAHLPI